MKNILTFFLVFAIAEWALAQNTGVLSENIPPQYDKSSGQFKLKELYFDANVGYFPQKENASWATQIGTGFCINEQSAVGIGAGVWGREHVFSRYGMGLGVQYRHNYPRRLLLKAEFGYLLLHKMHDGTLNKDMVFLSDASKPIYFKLEAHWRLWRILTLGVAATQSGDLFFERFVDNTRTSKDLWRINALTVQLGVAIDKYIPKSK